MAAQASPITVDPTPCVPRSMRIDPTGRVVHLFEKVLVDDGPDSKLTTASHIVIDCIRTMASRLEALDEQADALRETGGTP